MNDAKSLQKLRNLDFDDLLILYYTGKGFKYADIARALFIGNAAISHRLKKYKIAFPGFEIEYNGNKTKPNDVAFGVFTIAENVLNELRSINFANNEESSDAKS